MACGSCGSKNTTPMTFTHTAPDGSKTPKLSEHQARAMQIRYGGTFKRD